MPGSPMPSRNVFEAPDRANAIVTHANVKAASPKTISTSTNRHVHVERSCGQLPSNPIRSSRTIDFSAMPDLYQNGKSGATPGCPVADFPARTRSQVRKRLRQIGAHESGHPKLTTARRPSLIAATPLSIATSRWPAPPEAGFGNSAYGLEPEHHP